MSNFRLVVLDYVKEQLDNPLAKEIFADVLFVKQKNFLRTDPRLVVMDKHDMIGTHYLIYDTSSFLRPKLVFALRTTFIARAEAHQLETPLMSLLPAMSSHLQNKFSEFKKCHPQIVDCNAWFVDTAFSKKNSGLLLSDIGYFLVCMNVMRLGFDNIVGCTNETYNASRWLENVGSMEKGLLFEHPAVPVPHMMLLVSPFNQVHFYKIFQQYKNLIQETVEILPTNLAIELPSIANYAESLFGDKAIELPIKDLEAA